MSFADFPEQKQVVALLQRSLERRRLGHAYLVSGSDIAELEAVSRTLAKTLNCEAPKRGANEEAIDSCDVCASCRRIDEENHPDVFWLRPESKSRIITVDQMRELMQAVNLKPSMAAYKVGVISGVDRLRTEGANAFLKTLEEPPPRSILILLTTEPQRLLDTIISRCLRLTFAGERKPKPEEVRWLAAFAEMAANSQTGLLGRYRLLGLMVERLNLLRGEIEANLTAKSPLERYEELEPKMRDRLEDELAAAIEAEYRRQRTDLLLGIQLWLRDVWLATTTLTDDLLNFVSLAGVTGTVAKRLSPEEARQNLQVIEQTQRLLYTNVQEALALEVGFLKLKL